MERCSIIENTTIRLNVIDYKTRPVSVTADHNEFRNIVEVYISTNIDLSFKLM